MNFDFAKITPLWCQCASLALLIGGSQAAFAEAPRTVSSADAALGARVRAALHADRYLEASHVEVSAHDGIVEMRGIVLSDWDLRDALRIARRAAAGARVVDELALEEGGSR